MRILLEHRENGLFLPLTSGDIRITTETNGTIDRTTARAIAASGHSPFPLSPFEKYVGNGQWIPQLQRLPAVRQCLECGQWFLGTQTSKACGPACSRSALRKHEKAKREEWSNRRVLKLPTHCIFCRTPITAARASKQFCSSNCRHKALRRWA
jgi:hypothetical protein